LAQLLAALPHRELGRYLFCLADALCGWIILILRRRQRQQRQITTTSSTTTSAADSSTLADAVWWLYNPLAINICTRGSAESLMVLLPVLLNVWIVVAISENQPQQEQQPQNRSSWSWLPLVGAAVAAGICHGVAVHAKLYPIIYTVSFATNFCRFPPPDPAVTGILGPHQIVLRWIRRLLTPAPLIFGLVSMAVFGALTYAAVQGYGDIALQEGLLYHFSRVDHRHNYSMHWFWIYLARARGSANMSLVGRVLLLPQLVLLAYTSLGLAPHNLTLALFVQTFIFVAYNKVITAQYFTWYLCLLPLCSDQLRMTTRVQVALGLLAAAIIFWLGSAYCLEMQGWSVHRLVWFASMVFFIANVNLLGALLNSAQQQQKSAASVEQKKKTS
jgi:GPI mannosyltransferase 1 subunit M